MLISLEQYRELGVALCRHVGLWSSADLHVLSCLKFKVLTERNVTNVDAGTGLTEARHSREQSLLGLIDNRQEFLLHCQTSNFAEKTSALQCDGYTKIQAERLFNFRDVARQGQTYSSCNYPLGPMVMSNTSLTYKGPFWQGWSWQILCHNAARTLTLSRRSISWHS
jgi:hypothetical protein